MTISFMTFALFFGASILGLVLVTYKIQRDNAQYTGDLEFFIEQKTIAYNKEKAVHSVLKSRFEKLGEDFDRLSLELDAYKSLEEQFNQAIQRNQFLEQKHQEFEKLGHEISDIQETLNGPLKIQLTQYLESFDDIGKRLHHATHEFSERVSNLEVEDHEQAA